MIEVAISAMLLTRHSFVALFDYVMSDFQLHYDVMLAWLFEEYAVAEGYKGVVQPELLVRMEKYDKTVTDLLAAMRDQLDPKDKYVEIDE